MLLVRISWPHEHNEIDISPLHLVENNRIPDYCTKNTGQWISDRLMGLTLCNNVTW